MIKVDSFNLGVATEFIAAGKLIELGYEVYLPFDRRGKADLILYKDNVFIKVQIKRASWTKHKNKSNEYLRVVCSSHGVKYTEKEIDFLIALDEDYRMWKIPVKEIINRSTITLDKRVLTRGFSTKDKFNSELWRV